MAGSVFRNKMSKMNKKKKKKQQIRGGSKKQVILITEIQSGCFYVVWGST